MPTWVRATAETMPMVTVWPTPNGLPMASTRSPTSSSSESRSARVGSGAPGASIRSSADHPRGEFAPVGQRDGDLVAVLDDVIVGDDQSVRADDHAGSQGVLHPRHRPAEEIVAEEPLEERVIEERRHPGLDDAPRI